MPIFCFNFNFIFHFYFLRITLLFFTFVLWLRLQCQHSCQYFAWTLISFLISFSVTSFSISIFLFNNFFYITVVAVAMTAMPTLMPIYSTHVLYTGCDWTLDQPGPWPVYTVCTVKPLYTVTMALTNQKPRKSDTHNYGHIGALYNDSVAK